MRAILLSQLLASVARSAEAVPDDRTAVFPRTEAGNFIFAVCQSFPGKITGFWSPAISDLKDIELALPALLTTKRPELLTWLNGTYEGATRWTWLRRQAIGVLIEDRPFLLISYICEYPAETRQKEKEVKASMERMGLPYKAERLKAVPIAVTHGGMSYFRALFDVSKRSFTSYEENQ